jgi:hypothetical protein
MRILMIAVNDPAGTAIEFTKAINRYTAHTCRLITKEIRYNFLFEKDLHLPWLDEAGWQEVEDLLRTSDVFHFHMTADEYIELGPFKPVDYLHGKLIVHHHHGHPDFRGNPEKYRKKYKERGRNNLLVSTPDLLKLLPESRWQPNLVPIDDPQYTPLENKPDEPVVICHSPTRKDLKNTDEFVRAVNEIKKLSNVPIELRLIENTPHKKCLQLKRESHILFDHMQGYFGVSSLEGLSQGLCVIAGIDAWNRRCIEAFTCVAEMPWELTDHENLKECIYSLVSGQEYLRKRSIKSRVFMKNYWHPRRVAAYMVGILENDFTA